MKINKKGLTDKEIQELIDREIKWKKWLEEAYFPMYVRFEAMRIYSEVLRNLKDGK